MSLCKGSSIPLGMSQLISPLTQMHPGPHVDFDQLQGTMTPTPFLNSCHFSAPIKRLCEDTSGWFWHHGVPGLAAEVLLKVSRQVAGAVLLSQALAGRFGSTRQGTRPGALGTPLPRESGGSCPCSEGRHRGDAGVQGLGSAATWSCLLHPTRRFKGGQDIYGRKTPG